MKRLLIPVDATPESRLAVRRAIAERLADPDLEIHLANVQPAFSRHVAQFTSRRTREEFRHERAMEAMEPCAALLLERGIPFTAHVERGDGAAALAELASRLGCERILVGTARKDALTRLVEGSLTTRLIERTPVPVEVIAGANETPWERFGIPAALAGGLVALMAMVDD